MEQRDGEASKFVDDMTGVNPRDQAGASPLALRLPTSCSLPFSLLPLVPSSPHVSTPTGATSAAFLGGRAVSDSSSSFAVRRKPVGTNVDNQPRRTYREYQEQGYRTIDYHHRPGPNMRLSLPFHRRRRRRHGRHTRRVVTPTSSLLLRIAAAAAAVASFPFALGTEGCRIL